MDDKNFDIEKIHDFVEWAIMPDWVVLRDNEREAKASGKTYNPSLTTRLGDVQDLFYEKKYVLALTNYVSWLKDFNGFLYKEDVRLLKSFAEYIDVDPSILDDVRVIDE